MEVAFESALTLQRLDGAQLGSGSMVRVRTGGIADPILLIPLPLLSCALKWDSHSPGMGVMVTSFPFPRKTSPCPTNISSRHSF